MNFQTLPNIEKADTYIDIAIKNANKHALQIKEKAKKMANDRMNMVKTLELDKVESIKRSLVGQLEGIINKFPDLENLPDFYIELVKITIDYPRLKKSLGALNWARKAVLDMSNKYSMNIKRAQHAPHILKYSKEYLGRVCSIIKQIKKDFLNIEKSRKIMADFPDIKDGYFDVAIAGFPNVGKSTLLSKLTKAKPKIAGYAFTTKGLNIGYATYESYKGVQFVDTPGTLNRFEKMNYIEQQAYLVLKYVADMIVYVFDLTEPFPMDKQMKLYKQLKKQNRGLGIKIIPYLSKIDILSKEDVSEFMTKNKIKCLTEPKDLKKLFIENWSVKE